MAATFDSRRRRMVGDRPDSLANRSFSSRAIPISWRASPKGLWPTKSSAISGFGSTALRGRTTTLCSRRWTGASSHCTSGLNTMGMNGDEDCARSLSVGAESTITARSRCSWGIRQSRNKHAMKALASSTESPATYRGRSLGLASHCFTSLMLSATAGAKTFAVKGGSLAERHRSQNRSGVSHPCMGMGVGSLAASQTCPAIDCSSHCSRSLASNAFTALHSPASFLVFAHASLPCHLRGVTNTNVHSSRSASGMDTRLVYSRSALSFGSWLVPNSHPDLPCGIQGLAASASTQPSQPGRWASSWPGKSTWTKRSPVERMSVRRRTGSSCRASIVSAHDLI